MGNEQAFSLSSVLQPDRFGNLGSGQLFGLTTVMNSDGITYLGDEILEVMLLGFESVDLSALDNKRDGGISSLAGDDIIGDFDCDHVDAALGALGADVFGGESAGFAGIVGGDIPLSTSSTSACWKPSRTCPATRISRTCSAI